MTVRPRHGFTALAATSILVAALAAQTKSKGTAYAFLVACQDYDEAELRKLTYPRADIIGFRDALLKSGYADAHVAALHEKQDLSRAPERAKILKQLKRLLAMVEADDSVVVAFAGHGVMYEGDPASYFCPADSKLNDRSTLVKLDDVFDELKACPAARKLLLVDACRNRPESALRRSRGVENLKSATRPPPSSQVPKGVLALFSCAEGQESFEHPDLGHGVFFHHVIAGWSSQGNLDDLCRFVRKGTAAYVNGKFTDAVQTPVQRGEVVKPEEWALAVADVKREVPPPVSPTKAERVPAGAIVLELDGGQRIVCAAIPAGTVTIGWADGTLFAKPPHKVRITEPFWMATTHVTIGQFKRDGKGGAGIDSNGDHHDSKPQFSWKNTSLPQADDHPVVNVTWNDAVAFCQWLAEKSGRKVVLPTDAKWEYSCRAGATTKYFFGDDDDDDDLGQYAWFAGNTDRKGTRPVATKKPNAWGLYDMHGNARQWCRDSFRVYNENEWIDPSAGYVRINGDSRVLRGTGFAGPPEDGAASRTMRRVDERNYSVGFRVSVMR